MPLIVAGPECFPESAVERIRRLADLHPDAECEVAGGLAALLADPGDTPVGGESGSREGLAETGGIG